jgi:ABC-2 type transport system permease protein
MNKIGIIIGREYLHIVKKKSFLVMTILGPILLATLMIAPTLINIYGKAQTTIAVLDKTRIFSKLNSPNDKDISYVYVKGNVEDIKKDIIDKKYTAFLYIPYNQSFLGGMVYSSSSLGTGVMSNILASMKRNISNEILISDFGLDKDSLDLYIERQTNLINLGYTHIDKNGQEETKASYQREIQFAMGIIAGILIYFFIFMYGSMVLRGVLEEKSNRIVEVMISSVKPIQLMIGKIVGVALIGLTQILVWIVFTLIIVTIFQFSLSSVANPTDAVNTAEIMQNMPSMSVNTTLFGDISAMAEQPETNEFINALLGINFPLLIVLFLFYFVCGYFLYASLYAAVGAAVDNDADTQQFLLPLTVPLILPLILSKFIADNPDGQVAFWFSIIPFTSPISMLVRIPAGGEVVQMWELFLSCSILILTCIAAAWMTAKIYRIGILMYGKKISYKELWKWLKYKG